MEVIIGGVFVLVYLAILAAVLVGLYKTFDKMGYPDAWHAAVPILNVFFMVLKVLKMPVFWAVLCIIPCTSIVGFYIWWLVCDKVAKAFGKDTVFAVLLFFFGVILFPVLGFGSQQPQKTA